jgi:RIO-like serine/threonine protein kinase
LQASPISHLNLTSKAKGEVIKAFEAIHSFNVIHGDVRAENVLVGKDDKVWIVDFEFSEIVNGDSGNDEDTEKHAEWGIDYPERNTEYRISQENTAVRYLLSTLQKGSEVNGSHRNGSKQVS